MMVLKIFSHYKPLRTPANMLVMNLAFSDLMLMFTLIPESCIYFSFWEARGSLDGLDVKSMLSVVNFLNVFIYFNNMHYSIPPLNIVFPFIVNLLFEY